jgi:hypothetical protein
MVDDMPPVPRPTPGPPTDLVPPPVLTNGLKPRRPSNAAVKMELELPGPAAGSDKWIKAQETKQRRCENGAGIAFSTGKSIKESVFEECMFKEKADYKTSGDLPNLNAIHQGFVSKKLFEITNSNCHLIPSSNKSGPKGPNNKTKSPINLLKDFPKSDRDHWNFLQQKVSYNYEQRKTRVFLTHHAVLMQESVKVIKEKLWNYITEKCLWMRNSNLKSVKMGSIG